MSWAHQKYVKFPFVKTTNIQCQNGVGTNGISIGKDAGYNTQGTNAVAIGNTAGYNIQGNSAVAIGNGSGQSTQGANAVAIGTNAGQTNQGSGAVAIGINAGASSQAANSIVISALGTIVTGATANATYIAPIRSVTQSNVIGYNTVTSELTYFTAPSSPVQMAVLRETQVVNVGSGVTYANFTTTAQSKPRQFNDKQEAGLSITLSGTPTWTFTISAAGTYLFEATAILSVPTSDGQTVTAKLFLNNQTLGLGSVIVSDSYRYGPINSSLLTNTNFTHNMNGIYAIAGITVLRLDHVIVSPFFPPTGGTPSNILGSQEVYATLKITKLS